SGIPSPDARAEAEWSIVRDLDCLVRIAGTKQHRNWSEDLLPVNFGFARNIRQYRRFEIVAWAGNSVSSRKHPRSRSDGGAHLSFQIVKDRRCCKRAHIGRWIHRIADLKRSHRFDIPLLEILVHRVRNDKSLRGDARLPVVDNPRADPGLHGLGEIGRRHDVEWIASTKLQNRLLNRESSHNGHRSSSRLATC